jgi:hypothetical protein
MLAITLALSAGAASLDNLEVGGNWGTPNADNPTAIWWNPAGLATPGTHAIVELAPTYATVGFDRVDPYNGGHDEYKLSGMVPFVGFSTDAGIDGVGFGFGLAVPYARGGSETSEPGTGSFAMRHGNSQAGFLMLGAAAHPPGFPISVGFSGALVDNTWIAHVDSELTTSFDQTATDAGVESGYTDAQIEDPDYTAVLDFPKMKSKGFAFDTGIKADFDKVHLALGYISGVKLANKGDVTLTFSCPPQDDALGRFGAQQFGLCDSVINAHGIVAYNLPSRIHGGVRVDPIEDLRIEAMGGVVFWHVYQDFDITVNDVGELNPWQSDCDAGDSASCYKAEHTPGKVEQHRLWARDNKDSFWAALDVKGDLGEYVTLGGRVTYDKAAVPSSALSGNNYDANDVILGGLAAVKPVKWITIGAQYSHQFLATRVVDDSAFLVTLDKDNRVEDRYTYPQMNGTYTGVVHRIGLSVQGNFGRKADDPGFAE